MRESTSRNQANGSTLDRLQEAMKLRSTAAVLPPPSLPKNVQLPRPMAMSRLARSVAPLSISRSPSSRNQQEEQAGFVDHRDSGNRVARVLHINESQGARQIVIEDIVMDDLKVPKVLSGTGIRRDHTATEEVIA